jgi:hypothetical protein
MRRLVVAAIIGAMMACAVPVLEGPASASVATRTFDVRQPTVNQTAHFCVACTYTPPPPSSGTPGVQITFGWVIYIHLSYAETGNILVVAYLAGMFAAVGALCGVIGGVIFTPLCVGVMAAVGYYVISVMNTAYHQLHDGVVIELTYGLSFFGIMAVPDSWT